MGKIIDFPISDSKSEASISNIASNYKKIAIYGAGMAGRQLYAAYEDMLSDKVCCFLDDDPKDAEFMGKPIIKPENIPDDVDLVIISPQSRKAYENMKEKIAGKNAVWLRDLVF
jgi:predicted CoA-binding protein